MRAGRLWTTLGTRVPSDGDDHSASADHEKAPTTPPFVFFFTLSTGYSHLMTTDPMPRRPRLALYQPDIPQNTGTLMRLCACLGIGMDVIEPCGFVLSDKNLKRAGMDYLDALNWQRHADWATFQAQKQGRLIVLSTKASVPYTDFIFQNTDILLLGRESSGLPQDVHDSADARVIIPMLGGLRSLNVAIAGAMVLGEALRQTTPKA